MAQKHLQLLRNNNIYASYELALSALTSWNFTQKPLSDGTPVIARYTDTKGNQKTLLGVVNGTSMDIINNVSDYLLRNYAAFTGDNTAIDAADDVKTAIAKLEKHIQDVVADITVTVEEAQDANTQAHLDITATTSTTEGDTYTIGLKDVASESALTAEITARKAVDGQTGQTYVANSANYISNASSLNDADVKLDATLKAEEDARKAIEGQNGSTYAANPNSSYISGATSLNDADVKLNAAVESLSGAVSNLDANSVFGDSKVVIDVTQENGQITATAANLTGVKLDGYAEGTDADIAVTDTLGQALGKLQAQINAMDKTASAVDGQVVTTVVETDGKVTETKANVKDLQLGGYTKDTTATGDIASNDTVSAALSKLENTVTANKIANGDGSINVTTGADGTDINVIIKSDEHVLAKDGNAGLYTNIAISSVTGTELTDLGTNVKEAYKLVGTDNTKLGEYIKIYKDSSISKIYLGYPTDTVDKNSGTITSGTTGEAQSLNYVYHKEDGTYEMVHVDVSRFLAESEFASGVTAGDNGVVHGVVDKTSEKVVTTYNSDGTSATTGSVLTVGADGFKVSNVQTAIDAKIGTLDVSDTADDNRYVSSVSETDGKITVSRENLVNGKLSGYTKGSDSTAIATGDTLGQALGKLENQIDNAKAAATTKVVEGTDAGNNMEIVPTTGADESVTYTVNLTDVASASALTDEISHRKAVDGINGDAYTANTGTKYISGASSLNNADVLLDTAISGVDSALTAEIAARKAVDGQNGQTYAANTSAKYINNATSLNDADVKLDAALKALNDETIKTITSTNTGCTVTVSGEGNTRNIAVNTDGSQVKLTGYEATGATGAPAATDSVNAAIAKLYNRGTITSTNSGITVSQANNASTTITLNVSTATAVADSNDAKYAQADDGNAIQMKNDGIFVSSNWDCGTYDKPAGN